MAGTESGCKILLTFSKNHEQLTSTKLRHNKKVIALPFFYDYVQNRSWTFFFDKKNERIESQTKEKREKSSEKRNLFCKPEVIIPTLWAMLHQFSVMSP